MQLETPVEEIDFFTKEPRRKKVDYSQLSEEQIKSISKNSSAHFSPVKLKSYDDSRHYKDRYTYFTNKSNIRGSQYHHHTYLGQYVTRDILDGHNGSRFGAMFPWGQDKVGHRTLQNYAHQDVNRYVNIDMYKRNPTNYPGEIKMKFGRANWGYYAKRNMNDHMWFGGANKPKEHWILEDIEPKTLIQHQQKNINRAARRNHAIAQYISLYRVVLFKKGFTYSRI